MNECLFSRSCILGAEIHVVRSGVMVSRVSVRIVFVYMYMYVFAFHAFGRRNRQQQEVQDTVRTVWIGVHVSSCWEDQCLIVL